MQKVMVLGVIILLACSYCYAEPSEVQTGLGEIFVRGEESVGAYEDEQAVVKVEDVQAAKEGAVSVGVSLGRIFVTLGQSRLLTIREEVRRVSVTSPEVATVQAISPREILVDGKMPGVTTMIIWDAMGKTYIYDLTIQRDVQLLKERLLQIDEGIEMEIHPAQDAVILWGEVDSPAKITKAIAVAASFFEDTELHVLAGPGGTIVAEGYRPKPLKFAGQGGSTAVGEQTIAFEEVSRVWNVGEGAIITTKNGKVISFLRLKNPLQVELQVRFVQVDLDLLNEFGFDTTLDAFRFEDKKTGFVSSPTGLAFDTAPDASLTSGSGVVRYFLVHRTEHFLFQTQLRALENREIVKTLSEPNLTVISGQEATFLVGGEFPVLVPQSTSTTGEARPFFTVEWKVFGTKLELVPEVKETGMINLKLIPEVSNRSTELGTDFPTTSTTKVTIPGLATRRAETTVEIDDGDSLVIAGLLTDKETFITTQVPLLGDIPVLGTFFRKKSTRNERTELMIVVTPKLVKPMSPKEAERVTQSDLFRQEAVYEEFLGKRFEASKWLVGPFGYQ